MTITLTILSQYKSRMKRKFLALAQRQPRVPEDIQVPQDPEVALRVGILLGRQEGYSEGLVDGAELGLDVSQDVMDVMLAQPIIFGSPGVA